MSPLAKYLFAFLLNNVGPGSSPYSLQRMPECGDDPELPECRLDRVCEMAGPLCAAPRWNRERGSWVRVETREVAADRISVAAQTLTRTIARLVSCLDEGGSVIEDCEPLQWAGSARSLACMVTTISIYESGYREDVMSGYGPMGRGKAGEVCIMQVMPRYIGHPIFTPWMTEEQKALDLESRLQLVLGPDPASLSNCYETGIRILARKRRNAHYACRGIDWAYATLAFYGTGNRCTVATEDGDWAADRTATYQRCMHHWPSQEQLPDWAASYR